MSRILCLLMICIYAALPGAVAAPLDTQFTYQGELVARGAPASGLYDLEFRLYDAATGGIEIANPVSLTGVTVSEGIFSVLLDFGAAPFAGDALWLDIAVAESGSGLGLQPLSPRQPLTAAPYALHAEFVAMDSIGSLEIQDGAVASSDLADDSVTAPALADGAVGAPAIAAGAVTSQAIATGAVGSAALADGSVTGADLAPDSVAATHMAANAVTTDAIVDAAVTGPKLAPGAVGAAQVNTAQVQSRISGVCPVGRMLRGVNVDGSAVCGVPNKTQVVTNPLDDGNGANTGANSKVALGLDGLPVITYPTADGSTISNVAILKCNDLACSGNDETPFILDGTIGGQPSIAIGADGLPIVAFGFGDLHLARCIDPDCTSATVSDVDVGPESVGFDPQVVIGADGLPIIVYRGPTSVRVAKCNDPACAGGDELITDVDTDNLGLDNTIIIGSDGLPILTYSLFGDHSLRVAKCNDIACAGQDETITTLDDLPAGVTGRNNDLVNAADGLPLIVYEDGDADVIKVIKCNDLACAGGDDLPIVLDSSSTAVGIETSIALGVDGNPLVAFWDFEAAQLRVVHCNDQYCQGQDEASRVVVVTTDPPGGTGSGLDLIIGVDGLPLITFFDPPPQSRLGAVRCGRSDCAPFGD